MLQTNYNPDVLTCLANLSNDEVFTPPSLVNDILDLLPTDLWSNPKVKILDPVSKSGVFLREIAKRLDHGLESQIPDKQKRINHILKNQIYGIAITELTSFLSRRSLYGSKNANGQYSFCDTFINDQGNIHFEKLNHTWQSGKCVYCGAGQDVYDRGDELENYAYKFIHIENSEKIFNMKFDIIIGNPPYQLNTGIEQESYAIPLYNKFIEQAKKLNPKYLSMIIPSRWFAGGRGLDEFRNVMLNDKRIQVLHDFPNSSECFPGVEIKGGVCYFLWNRDYNDKCMIYTHEKNEIKSESFRFLLEPNIDTFIRYNEGLSILEKINKLKENKFSTIVSPQTPFGIISSFNKYSNTPFKNSIKIYLTKKIGFISENDVIKNNEWINKYKVYITKSYGAGEGFPHQILNKPFFGDKNTCCSQTYLLIGTFKTKKEAENVLSYISTKFFRFMVMLKKNTQDAMRGVYDLVPMQDFNELWTDEKLNKKYGLSNKEISFIDSMIRPMDLAHKTSEDE
jgi:site-specific DNA-methyltransferase (adenine-specific)